MSTLLTLFANQQPTSLPLHEQLVRTLRSAILAGHLPMHSRLPASRTLAADLAVSRSTVELAYGRLEAEGYLTRKAGAGSFVALAVTTPSPRPAQSIAGLSRRGLAVAASGACHDIPQVGLSFASSQPDPRLFPHSLWGRLMQQQWRQQGERWMNYGDPQGLPELRAAISSYLVQSRGVVCDPDQILILTSSQQGILLATQLLIDAGDTVWVEEPGYPGARTAMESAGAIVHPVPVDDQGLNPLGNHPRPRLIYTTPAHQYPLGVAMSLSRRIALLHEAQQHGAWILEDDYDGEYQYDARPLPALQGLDSQGRVIYVGTFSKVLFGSLRLAYLVLPTPLMAGFCRARAAFDGHSNQLQQAVTADFIRSGHFATHLRQSRQIYHSRRDLLLTELGHHCPQLTPIHSGAGLQCAVGVPTGGEVRWTSIANGQGIGLRPLSQFYLGPATHEGWLLGFASLDNQTVRQLCHRLGSLLKT
ncbi:PLP-dependent aminotransferase family protein [Aeromonas cavernicola]|uniref:GntR family transcriptional regulator n=1 Tax=Aeromonas cavernicola TaxID=1006623 RepID=A0A2H9U280_9GAMM|nr:PLP-dependent aminotransferase family protein [Aeromonas cavernicola]PJG58114.1 GntR family transcriptional regulator [Aeromonas cavernicola]